MTWDNGEHIFCTLTYSFFKSMVYRCPTEKHSECSGRASVRLKESFIFIFMWQWLFLFSSMMEYFYFVVLNKSQKYISLLSHQEHHDLFCWFQYGDSIFLFFLISWLSGNRWIKGLLCPVKGRLPRKVGKSWLWEQRCYVTFLLSLHIHQFSTTYMDSCKVKPHFVPEDKDIILIKRGYRDHNLFTVGCLGLLSWHRMPSPPPIPPLFPVLC